MFPLDSLWPCSRFSNLVGTILKVGNQFLSLTLLGLQTLIKRPLLWVFINFSWQNSFLERTKNSFGELYLRKNTFVLLIWWGLTFFPVLTKILPFGEFHSIGGGYHSYVTSFCVRFILLRML